MNKRASTPLSTFLTHSNSKDQTRKISSKDGQLITMDHNRYRILYQLGKGGQGRVYCVEKVGTKEYFAMKVCKPSQYVATQIQVQKSCNCPNIVGIIESRRIQDNIYIILELGECNLEKYLTTKPGNVLEEEELFRLIRDISNGLKVIHQYNYIHHDMKPSNIILNLELFKIADFGVSQKEVTSYRGTSLYYAPESLEMKIHKGACGPALDIWAFGIIVFQSCFHLHPFLFDLSKVDDNYHQKQISQLSKDGYSFYKYKNSLKKQGKFSSLSRFQQREKALINRDLLEYFFTRTFTYEPTQRLKLDQVNVILAKAKPCKGVQYSPQQQVYKGSLNNSEDLAHLRYPNPTRRANSFTYPYTGGQTAFYDQSSIPLLQKSYSVGSNTDKTQIIEFMYRSLSILNSAFASFPEDLREITCIFTSIIRFHQIPQFYNQAQAQTILVGIFNKRISMLPLMPGVFFRLIVAAHLPQILRNFDSFMIFAAQISPTQVKTYSFGDLDRLSDGMNVNKLRSFASVVQSLK